MILDLYARLEQRHWLDLVRLPVVLVLAFACFILGAPQPVKLAACVSLRQLAALPS